MATNIDLEQLRNLNILLKDMDVYKLETLYETMPMLGLFSELSISKMNDIITNTDEITQLAIHGEVLTTFIIHGVLINTITEEYVKHISKVPRDAGDAGLNMAEQADADRQGLLLNAEYNKSMEDWVQLVDDIPNIYKLILVILMIKKNPSLVMT